MNISYAEIKSFWGDSIKELNLNKIIDSLLSNDTQEFLKKVGLPNTNDIQKYLLMNFYGDDLISVFTKGPIRYLVIGSDYENKICLTETTNEVYSVGELQSRFINSNIRSLVLFLHVLLTQRAKLVGSTDEEAKTIVDGIREIFNRIDIKALENQDNWWSIVLEQIELGLM
jgi:hypothetical protein